METQNTRTFSKIHLNGLGTITFTAKVGSMRKAEEFTVYPIAAGARQGYIDIQSENRWGQLFFKENTVILSSNLRHSSNNLNFSLDRKKQKIELDPQEVKTLLACIAATAKKEAGNNRMRIFCDNSGAEQLFCDNSGAEQL